MLAKSLQLLQPVTYLLFLYPLSCQHLRPPAPRSAQPAPGKMRIETARLLLEAACPGSINGGPLPVSRMFRGARGASFIKQSPKRQRGVKQPGNTEHEKATMQQKMRTNRPAMHHPSALGASSQLGAEPLLPTPRLSGSPKRSARQVSSPARLSTKGSAPAKKHPQPPRNGTVSGTFQPENSRKKGNTYYKQIRQTTHSYTTYGNTRGAEKGKIAETLSYPDIFCQNTT